jgi:hypothetical protein
MMLIEKLVEIDLKLYEEVGWLCKDNGILKMKIDFVSVAE